MQRVLYEELSPDEFRARIMTGSGRDSVPLGTGTAPVAYLPLGTLEYHGEHLPYGTDGIIPREFFRRLAERVGRALSSPPGIVLPMLWIGLDTSAIRDGNTLVGMECYWRLPERLWGRLDGSCYHLDGRSWECVLDAMLVMIQDAGFRVLVAHGHAPSRASFRDRARHWPELRCLTCSDELMSDHGGVNETSLMMALRPDLVHMERLDPGAAWPMRGTWGTDPRNGIASAELGERIIEAELDRMAAEIGRMLHELR